MQYLKNICVHCVNGQSEIIKDYLKNPSPLPVTLKTEALVDIIVYLSNFSFLFLSSSFTNLLSIYNLFSSFILDHFVILFHPPAFNLSDHITSFHQFKIFHQP